jgi:dihydroorotase
MWLESVENETFHSEISHTFVNGFLAFENGKVSSEKHAERLQFDR